MSLKDIYISAQEDEGYEYEIPVVNYGTGQAGQLAKQANDIASDFFSTFNQK